MFNPCSRSNAITNLAPAEGTVERELSRFKWSKALATLWACKKPTVNINRPIRLFQRIAMAVVNGTGNKQCSVPGFKSRFNTLGNSASLLRVGSDSINYELKSVFLFSIQRRVFIKPIGCPVNSQSHIARCLKPRKKAFRGLTDLELNRSK